MFPRALPMIQSESVDDVRRPGGIAPKPTIGLLAALGGYDRAALGGGPSVLVAADSEALLA